ncbi:MAG: hypothetical protein FWG64_13400 [Firmicutes bacterium]|nr:hypothetical protein [Bacillota bacterium]
MKKIIVGVGLIICATIEINTAVIVNAILTASPNNVATAVLENPFFYIGLAMYIVGISLIIWGFLQKGDKNERIRNAKTRG